MNALMFFTLASHFLTLIFNCLHVVNATNLYPNQHINDYNEDLYYTTDKELYNEERKPLNLLRDNYQLVYPLAPHSSEAEFLHKKNMDGYFYKDVPDKNLDPHYKVKKPCARVYHSMDLVSYTDTDFNVQEININVDATIYNQRSASHLKPERLFIFGGQDVNGKFLNDLHFFDLNDKVWSGEILRKWCCQDNNIMDGVENQYKERPRPRAKHATAVVATYLNGKLVHRLYVFGGMKDLYNDDEEIDNFYNNYQENNKYFDDLHYLDLKTLTWSGAVQTTGSKLTGRSGSNMIFYNRDKHLYIFGGISEKGGVMSDIHKFDIVSLKFTKIRPSSVLSGNSDRSTRHQTYTTFIPPPRQLASSVLMSAESFASSSSDNPLSSFCRQYHQSPPSETSFFSEKVNENTFRSKGSSSDHLDEGLGVPHDFNNADGGYGYGYTSANHEDQRNLWVFFGGIGGYSSNDSLVYDDTVIFNLDTYTWIDNSKPSYTGDSKNEFNEGDNSIDIEENYSNSRYNSQAYVNVYDESNQDALAVDDDSSFLKYDIAYKNLAENDNNHQKRQRQVGRYNKGCHGRYASNLILVNPNEAILWSGISGTRDAILDDVNHLTLTLKNVSSSDTSYSKSDLCSPTYNWLVDLDEERSLPSSINTRPQPRFGAAVTSGGSRSSGFNTLTSSYGRKIFEFGGILQIGKNSTKNSQLQQYSEVDLVNNGFGDGFVYDDNLYIYVIGHGGMVNKENNRKNVFVWTRETF